MNDGGGVHLLHHRGAGELVSRLQAVPVVDGRVLDAEFAAEEDPALSGAGIRRARPRGRERRQPGLRHPPLGHQPHAHQLHGLGLGLVAVGLLVDLVEALLHQFHVVGLKRRHRTRHGELVALPGVAQVQERRQPDVLVREALFVELLPCLLRELIEQGVDVAGLELLHRSELGAHVVVLHVRHQQAQGGVDPRRQRHQQGGDAEVQRQPAGVHGTGAAEGHQGELPDVVTALGRHRLDGLFHLDVDDLEDAVRGLVKAQPQGLGNPLLHHRLRLLLVEGEAPAEKVVGVQHPQDDVGIGDGGVLAAVVVADGAGVGAGAVGSHLERPHRIDARNGAAARAHGVDVEHGQADGPLADAALGGDHRAALVDQRHVATGAAHVEGDDVVDADLAADAQRRDDAPRGPGEHRGHRFAGRGLERRHAAVGLHDVELGRVDPHLPQAGLQPVQVGAHHGRDVGVDDRGAHAKELADLRQHLARQRQARLRELLGHELLDRQLVVQVQEGEQETHGHGFHALGLEPADGFRRLLKVHRCERPPLEIHAFGDLLGGVRAGQQAGLLEEEVVGHRPVAPALLHDLVDAAEPLGHQQAGDRPLLLQQGVGAHGRAVGEEAHVPGRHSPVEQLLDPVEHRLERLLGGRGHLGDADLAAVLIEENEVGKGPSGVHRYSISCHRSCVNTIW